MKELYKSVLKIMLACCMFIIAMGWASILLNIYESSSPETFSELAEFDLAIILCILLLFIDMIDRHIFKIK